MAKSRAEKDVGKVREPNAQHYTQNMEKPFQKIRRVCYVAWQGLLPLQAHFEAEKGESDSVQQRRK